ncbi:MAG TPA: gamma-glutamyltransferase [Euzebyales bacterium]|nr:gamma-glutamyltransferase [Euzebyales bacterium]
MLAALVPVAAAAPGGRDRAPHKDPVATGRGGAVSTVDPVATEAGLEVLRNGGNAVDAAVAAAATLGVTEPYSAGIGGGGFMLIRLAETDEIVVIDGREEGPDDIGSTSTCSRRTPVISSTPSTAVSQWAFPARSPRGWRHSTTTGRSR